MGSYKYEAVYSSIKKVINEKYEVGDRLFTDKYYSDYYKVSIITVKKAMKLLVLDGYIERKSGMPTKVIAINVQKKRYSLIIPNESNAFGNIMVKKFELWCLKNNHIPLISKTFEIKDYEISTIKNHLLLETSGIILMPVAEVYYNQELIELSKMQFPLVTIDRRLSYLPISVVKSDAVSDSIKLVQAINLRKQEKKILVISPPLDKQTPIYDRFKSVVEELENSHISYKIIYTKCCIGSLSENIKEQEREVLSNLLLAMDYQFIGAIVCMHYELAHLISEIIDSEKKKIEIISFDSPSGKKNKFTHIKQNEDEIITTAIELLVSNKREVTDIEIKGKLVKRNI